MLRPISATPRSIARSGVTDDPTATPTELPATAVPTVAGHNRSTYTNTCFTTNGGQRDI